MIERARTFGDTAELACVITEGAPRSAQDDLPAVVMWNAGLLPSVGPYRMYVDLARRLAESGFTAMRFDLSGIGDSAPDKSAEFSEERAVSEVRQAMDFIESSRGVSSFVLVGLCSGAVDSHYVAVEDARVRGAVMLDGYAYRTGGFYLRHYGSRALRLPTWLRWIGRGAGALRRDVDGPADPKLLLDELNYREYPSRERAEEDVERLVERGARLLYVYSGGAEGHFNNGRQFREMFPRVCQHPGVQVLHLPDADHLYTVIDDREELIRAICTWFEAKFGVRRGRK